MLALLWLLASMSAASAQGADPAPVDPVSEALRAATVSGVYGGPVELVDGHYEGAPFMEGSPVRPRLDLIADLHHVVDFDRDGAEEVVAYLEENSGGTGHFLYVAVFEASGDSLVSRAVRRLGDREQIRSSRVEGRSVVLDLIAHGPHDAGCCPNQLQRRHLTLSVGGEIEERREILGEATAALLDGSAWRLRSFTYLGKPIEDAKVTLRFDGGRMFGSAGCNRFEVDFSSPRRRELEVGPIIRTKKMCVSAAMAVERQFLAALERVSQWNFLAGRLALLYLGADERPRSLIFEAD